MRNCVNNYERRRGQRKTKLSGRRGAKLGKGMKKKYRNDRLSAGKSAPVLLKRSTTTGQEDGSKSTTIHQREHREGPEEK